MQKQLWFVKEGEKAELNHGKNLNEGMYPFVALIQNENKIINLSLPVISYEFSPVSSSLPLGVAQLHVETAVLLGWSTAY